MEQRLKSSITALTLFLLPLFFLPITHEFYNINKIALLLVASLALLSVSAIQFIKSRKLEWSKNVLQSLRPVLAFLIIIAGITFLRSSNPVQVLLDPALGLIPLTTLVIMYWYMARENGKEARSNHRILFGFGGLFISALTLIIALQPFRSLALPQSFEFLKSTQFSPLGTQRDLAVFLGFLATYHVFSLIESARGRKKTDWFSFSVGISAVIGLCIALHSIFTVKDPSLINGSAPVGLSIKSVIREMSSLPGLASGGGINSFSTAFTQVKDSFYNQSGLWQINSFDLASSALLQLLAEAGILGAGALIWIFISGFLTAAKHDAHRKITLIVLLCYVSFVFIIAPPSLISFFILFVTLGFFASESPEKQSIKSLTVSKKTFRILTPILTLIVVTGLITTLYSASRVYLAEVAMRNAIEAVPYNDLNRLYSEQRKAVILNPFMERYRLNFSQTNLFIAKQLAVQPNPDQQLITRTVQAAINEAQAAIALNPRKASHWENLGIVYRNVLGIKDTDKWAISAYQRAVLLDPQNISYRLGLGGIYYSIGQYENAIRMFNEVVTMKPDLANAYYNLAYAYYQNNNAQKAVEVMDILLPLLKRQSSSNYEKVVKERADFLANPPDNKAPSVIQ